MDSGFVGVTVAGEGHDVRLSEKEQQQVIRLLGDPTYFPIEFKQWLKDYIENSDISISASQVRGRVGGADALGFPPGVIVPVAFPGWPSDCLPCDGASYLRVDLPKLFEVIGTWWGSADSSHFNVPDFRDRAIYGSGSEVPFAADDGNTYGGGSRGGPNHVHDVPGSTSSAGGHNHSQGAQNVGGVTAGGSFTAAQESSTGSSGSHSHSFYAYTVGHGGAVPSYAGCNYVISAGQNTDGL